MLVGHGPIDYIVVIFSLFFSISLLRKKPIELLLYLPTLLSIDFFIPVASDLTTGRLLPLFLVVWLVKTGSWKISKFNHWWIESFLITIAVSIIFAIIQDDAGMRPVIRGLSYLNLVAIFSFVYQIIHKEKGFLHFFKGLAVAGIVHGTYSIYQVLAHYLGLPYRGIVRSANVVSSAVLSNGAFRINGLADEPKRLGLILIASAVAILFLSTRQNNNSKKMLATIYAVIVFILSLLTYSSSYILSLLLWLPALLLLSKRSYKYAFGLIIFFLFLSLIIPSSGKFYLKSQFDLLNARQEEIESGLDAETVYRQEFYARDFILKHPEVGFTGVGIGRYNQVFSDEYGGNAGLTENGKLAPLNSELLQVVYDFGVAGIILVYCFTLYIVYKIRKKGEIGFFIASILLYEIIQSLFVQSLPIMFFTAGAGASLLQQSSHKRFSQLSIK